LLLLLLPLKEDHHGLFGIIPSSHYEMWVFLFSDLFLQGTSSSTLGIRGSNQNLIGKGSNQRNEKWTGSSAVGGRKLEATMVIRKVIKKYNINEQPNDFSFWQSKSYEERLEALEQIRKEYNSWRYNAEQGFQRIYRVVKRKNLE